jgi:Cu+-exporting ATPase
MTAPAGTAPAADAGATVELAITGMTCASCANRIERKLNKLEGVTATVNYATERARVSYPPGMPTEELLSAVDAAGYSARLPEPERPAGSDGAPARGLVEADRVDLLGPAARAGHGAHRPGDRAVDGAGPAVPRLAVAGADAGGTGRAVGEPGRSTGRRGRTPATARPRWTR